MAWPKYGRLIIGFLFISVVAFASDEERSGVYVINSFEKGLMSHLNEYIESNESCHDCRNVRFNKTYGGVSKREELISEVDTGGSNVTGLYRYYKSDDSSYLISSEGTNLLYKADSDSSMIVLRDGQSDGYRWSFETYKNNLLGTSGQTRPIKWDGSTSITANTAGHRTALNMCADLGAPFADLTTGTDLSASSAYQYKILFNDGTNYYYSNARSNPILTGAAVYNINLTDIPIGDNDTTSRQIYRTNHNTSIANVEADTTFRYVATLSNNVTRSWADTVGEGTWATGATLSTSGNLDVTPPYGSYILIHDERAFIAGDPSNKSYLYWSDQFNPDFFLATAYEEIRPDDGGEITFIKTLLGILVIGKTNNIQKFFTDGSVATEWSLSDPISPIGCPAPYSAANTPNGITYLNRDGLYLFDGQYSVVISDAVTPEIRDIDKANIEECFGIYYNNEYQLAYTSDSSGSSTNDRVLIYDLIRKNFSKDYKNVNCMATLEGGSDYGALFYGASNNGYIYKEGAAENALRIRYLSDLDDGTYDDTHGKGSETNPMLDISWDLTWGADFQTLGYGTLENMTTSTFAREDTDAHWISEIYQINADTFEKLYWNERLNSYGDVECQIRTGTTSVACGTATWSDQFTTPSGSDISDVTANNFMQLRCNLSTSDIIYTPEVYLNDNYLFKVVYDKEGEAYESAVNTYWEGNWFEPYKRQRALIKNIRIYYIKDLDATGDITFNLKNSEGDIDVDFTLDMDQDSFLFDEDNSSKYQLIDGNYTYTHYLAPESIGNKWKLSFSENDIYQYNIYRIEAVCDNRGMSDI